MPMMRVIPIWVVVLGILLLTGGVLIGRATSSPPQVAGSSSRLVPPDLNARRWPDGYHDRDCQGPPGALVCEVDLVGPVGVQAGSYAGWNMEVRRDGGMHVEHFTCGPIHEDRVTRCASSVHGDIFQGNLTTTTFTLANGEQRTLSYRGRCYLSTPDGEVCRRHN